MPEIDYRLYRRQFYVGPQPKLIDESWRACALAGRLFLSYSGDLPVQKVQDGNGNQFVLLGTAIESLPGRPGVLCSLQNLSGMAALPQTYASWAGRWALIANHELHLDASGLLGCYYKNGPAGVEVASAPSFMAETAVPDTFRLLKVGGAEFYPPPGSGFTAISKLLPSQVLNLHTGSLAFRSLQCPVPPMSYTDSIAYLAMLLTTTLKNTVDACKDKKLLLALTGGYDSRTLMAALNHCGLPYETLTFHSPNIRPSDAGIPKKLAQLSGKAHRLIKRGGKKKENWDKYNAHTCGHAVEADRDYMLYQQFDRLSGDAGLLLRGGGFEVGRCAYYPWLPPHSIDGAGISLIQKGNAAQGASWDRWLQWVAQTPHAALDWRDRYYIEQRLAGWLSCTEQALDLVNIERMVPANATLFYSVMLNIPENIRKTKVQMKDLIGYLSPELLQVPINPPVNFYYKQYRRALFRLAKMKQSLNWA